MVPSKKPNSQNWLPGFFNDFIEGNFVHKFGSCTPAMNVIEDENCYKIEIAAPGMCKKDVTIHVTKDNKLVIEMERKCEDKIEESNDGKECKDKNCKDKEGKSGKYLRREFSCSKLHQTLALPDIADRNGIEANVKHGILYITIPKLSREQIQAATKAIEVK